MNTLPEHLGGHKGRTHLDEGVLDYMIGQYNVKSMLDIGCGPGGMVDLAVEKKLQAIGIDGDFTVSRSNNKFVIHDYTKGPSNILQTFDLVWSCEFVEHVEEEYFTNYINDFQKGKYVVMTFSEKSGYHHVNCKPKEYWVERFEKSGFEFLQSETDKIRNLSTMNIDVGKKKQFVKNNGLFFKNLQPL